MAGFRPVNYSRGRSSEDRSTQPMPSLQIVESVRRDLRHWLIVMIVFGITGFSALVFSRMLFNVILDMEGSLWSGPWSYRIMYLAVIPPFYLRHAGACRNYIRQARVFRAESREDVESSDTPQESRVAQNTYSGPGTYSNLSKTSSLRVKPSPGVCGA